MSCLGEYILIIVGDINVLSIEIHTIFMFYLEKYILLKALS